MYIYYAVTNTLSSHMIRINLKYDILYTRIAQFHPNNPHKSTIRKDNPCSPPPRIKTTMNSNVYDPDLYYTSYTRARAHACTHARTHTDCSRNY